MNEAPGPRPLGILGGTFDPVHYGHLRLAEEARAALDLERILWLPAGQPPHRQAPAVSARHRLELVRLAIADNPAFSLDDAEVQSAAPSYTVTSLARLRRLHGAQMPLVLLLGADAFAGLCSWHRWRELFALTHLAVATRPGYALDPSLLPAALADELRLRLRTDAGSLARAGAGSIVPFAITSLDISATRIREALATAGSVRYLLPDPVLDYIAEHNLYHQASH
ncbi:MAG TPA: nicotinate-nucleotide adenylyltransferase [Rhodocyclaceae bacterium]|nr:nicotinate-nucleotide adenylyltransferase [Rhodocyclaceae bacterium]